MVSNNILILIGIGAFLVLRNKGTTAFVSEPFNLENPNQAEIDSLTERGQRFRDEIARLTPLVGPGNRAISSAIDSANKSLRENNALIAKLL